MFESRTYEALLASALSRVASPVDKREGSMVMNGVAPSMAELAQLYIAADFVLQATYIITAPREYLIKRAHDRNMDPYPASPAVYRAEFNIEVPVGTRFSCEDLNFVVTARMDTEEDTETGLSHQVTCETPGTRRPTTTAAPSSRWSMCRGSPMRSWWSCSSPAMMRRKRRLSASGCWIVF